jgi:hypothetical protein
MVQRLPRLSAHPWARSSSGTRRSKLEWEVMTLSFTITSVLPMFTPLIGHESALISFCIRILIYMTASPLPHCSTLSPPRCHVSYCSLYTCCMTWSSLVLLRDIIVWHCLPLVVYKLSLLLLRIGSKVSCLVFPLPTCNRSALLSSSCGG